MSRAPSRALLETFKWLRVTEITAKVDLVCKHWQRTAEIPELWAFLLEQELLVYRTSPMCLQDYPSLAAKYIASRNDFVDFWRGAKEPHYLIFNSQKVTLWDIRRDAELAVPLNFEDGYRAAIYQDHSVVVMGFEKGSEYRVVMFDVETGSTQTLPISLERRIQHAIVADKDNIYISGGFQHTTLLRSAEMLTPSTSNWSALPPMNFPAHSHTMVVINSRLFTFGGGHDRAELYTGTEWVQLDLFLPIPLVNFGIVVTSFREVLVVGGHNGYRSPNVHTWDPVVSGHNDPKPSQFVYQLDLMTASLVKLVQCPALSIIHNAVCCRSHKITVLCDSAVQCLSYSLQFPVTVQWPRHLEDTVWLKPNDTVQALVQKFKEMHREAMDLDLIVSVEGRVAFEDLSVIAAGISSGSHIVLLDQASQVRW